MKKIWIWNHYATNMYKEKGGRHHWISTVLKNKGYDPIVFTASTNHSSPEKTIKIDNTYELRYSEKIPYIFIPTRPYSGNGLKRIINMISFYIGLMKASKELIESNKPDYILASSVHPLTLLAGLRVSRKNGIPCICEIRDLWPESLVAYGIISKNNPLTKFLYWVEKQIYKKSDLIIMTWEGGEKYIEDRGWLDVVDKEKIVHISNGVLLSQFDKNARNYEYKDKDLDNPNHINIVYTGSIRKVNDLDIILDSAKILKMKAPMVKILIFGDGDQKCNLEKRCVKENINNVMFKGKVSKSNIPSILMKADINLLHNKSTSLNKYGQSQNKLFEYLASGRPILQTYQTEYSVIDKFYTGICCDFQSSKEIAEKMLFLISDHKRLNLMGENARRASKYFDFNYLTDKLVKELDSINTVK